jgi:hypothetical protein
MGSAAPIWTGRQWQVTRQGLITTRGNFHYFISRREILKGLHPGRVGRAWPPHMAEKTWVDIDDFCEAWLRALEAYEVASPRAATVCQQVLGHVAAVA